MKPAEVEGPEVPEADESAEVLIPEVPLIDEDEAGTDPTVHYRSMSRESLMRELTNPLHRMCHVPHNPLCDICVKANLKQRKFAHSGREVTMDCRLVKCVDKCFQLLV